VVPFPALCDFPKEAVFLDIRLFAPQVSQPTSPDRSRPLRDRFEAPEQRFLRGRAAGGNAIDIVPVPEQQVTKRGAAKTGQASATKSGHQSAREAQVSTLLDRSLRSVAKGGFGSN
jgi:hypothetical protein